MAVSYNSEFKTWQVNGRGSYPTQAAAQAADTGGSAATGGAPDTFAGTAGTAGPSGVNAPAAPTNTRTISRADAMIENDLHRAGQSDLNGDGRIDAEDTRLSGVAYGTRTRTAPSGSFADQRHAYESGNIGGAGGAWNMTGDAGRAGYQKMHDDAEGFQVPWERIGKGVLTGGLSEVSRATGLPLDPITGTEMLFDAANDVFGAPGAGKRPGSGLPADSGAGQRMDHGVTPPGGGGGAGGDGAGASTTNPSGALGGPPGFATFDRSGYTTAQNDLNQARDTFLSELDRLSGVDPFGNQAFLQKATDRAVAQASGTAAMARGGAAAQAGANRTAQGVQAQQAARGTQEMEQIRSRDEVMAGELRGKNAAGLAGLATQRAGLEVEVAAKETETLQRNLDQWIQYSGVTLPLEQSDIENIRQMALGYAQVDMERYKTDVGYQTSVDNNLTQRYGIDAQKAVELKKIAASENMSFGEFLQGAMGAAAGVAMVASDERVKTHIRDPDLRDLQDFLGNTKGKLYRYRDPKHPGRRAGLNYGPMAQDLQKSKIGRTVVVEGPGGLYVDTGRLALADHAAIAELARDIERLKARK